MEIEVNKNVKLKLFDKTLIKDFFTTIHASKNTEDEYVRNLQRKYNQFEKLEERITDAVDNKFKSDGTPDFFIFYKNKIAGVFEFHPLSKDDFVEVGFWLFPEYRRNGIISAVFPKVVQYAKNNFLKNKILATTSIKNIPSQKLLEHVEFQKTGKILEYKQESGKVDREIEYIYTLRS